jgi:DNA processing protein
MSQKVTAHIRELEAMKKYPDPLFYKGDLALLHRPKVSIVGTRSPSVYTQNFTYTLAKAVIYKNKRYPTIINGTIRHANV